MNILLFSPTLIHFPIDAGSRIRIYNLGKYFQKMGHTIHFVYYADNGMDYDSFQFMQDNWDTFTVIAQKDIKERHGENYALNERYEIHISERVNSLVSKFKIDLVWTNYIFQSAFLETLPDNIFKVIDTHDVFTDRYKLFENVQDTSYTWYSYAKEDEAKALDRADLVIAITEKEATYFTSISKTNVKVIGHIESEDFLDRDYTDLRKIGFIGGANDVNIISINNFLDMFYRRSEYSEQVEIVIAGLVCNHINHKNDNLKLLGLVEDLKVFYRDADLIINPLTLGTGQKIKSVEALSYGVPIISTSIGFKGIESQEKYHQIKNITEMIKIIDSITQTPELLNDLAKSSKKIFKQYQNSLEKKIENVFSACNIVNARPEKDSTQLQEYRQKMKREFDELIVRSQEKLLEEKTAHVLKQSAWIKKQEQIIREKNKHIEKQSKWIKEQEKIIEQKSAEFKQLTEPLKELSTVSTFYHPIEKLKKYKDLMKIYHKIKITWKEKHV